MIVRKTWRKHGGKGRTRTPWKQSTIYFKKCSDGLRKWNIDKRQNEMDEKMRILENLKAFQEREDA